MKTSHFLVGAILLLSACSKPTDPSPVAGDLCLVTSVMKNNDSILRVEYDSLDRVSACYVDGYLYDHLEAHTFTYNGNEITEKYVDYITNDQPVFNTIIYQLNSDGYVSRKLSYDTTDYFYNAEGYLLNQVSTNGNASNYYYSSGNLDSVTYENNGVLLAGKRKYEYTTLPRPSNFPNPGFPFVKGKASKNLESRFVSTNDGVENEEDEQYNYSGYTAEKVNSYSRTRAMDGTTTYQLSYKCK